jgi:hypothetical protein
MRKNHILQILIGFSFSFALAANSNDTSDSDIEDLKAERTEVQTEILEETTKINSLKAQQKGGESTTEVDFEIQKRASDKSESERLGNAIIIKEEEKKPQPFKDRSPYYASYDKCSKSCERVYQESCSKHSSLSPKCQLFVGNEIYVCRCIYSEGSTAVPTTTSNR